jgi:translation initiation factor 1A
MSKKDDSSGEELRIPMEGEVVGVVVQLLGYDRAKVKCDDLETRVCRIPGKFKKKVWIREGDYVLVAPWDFQPKTRGDIIHYYTKDDVRKLVEKGYIKNIKPG